MNASNDTNDATHYDAPRWNVLDVLGVSLIATYLALSGTRLYFDTPAEMANRTMDDYRNVELTASAVASNRR